MRTSLLPLLLLATALCAQEVSVTTPEIPRGPDCTLPIPPMANVPVSAEVDRWYSAPKDHILLFVSGDVLLAGDCKSGTLDLGLERMVDHVWEEVVPLPKEIPYCTPPNTTWDRQRMEVDVAALLKRGIKRKDRKVFWRFTLRDVSGQQLWSDGFRLTR